MNGKNNSETDFEFSLRQFLRGQQMIETLLEHPAFVKRSRATCRLLTTNEYDSEDLFQEVCLRVLKYGDKLTQANTPNERAFFAWLHSVTRNIFFDTRRKKTPLMDAIPLEEISISDPTINLDRDHFVREFKKLIDCLPTKRRIAMSLWLEGYTFREISGELKKSGFLISHVTVRMWLKEFQKNMIDDLRPASKSA